MVCFEQSGTSPFIPLTSQRSLLRMTVRMEVLSEKFVVLLLCVVCQSGARVPATRFHPSCLDVILKSCSQLLVGNWRMLTSQRALLSMTVRMVVLLEKLLAVLPLCVIGQSGTRVPATRSHPSGLDVILKSSSHLLVRNWRMLTATAPPHNCLPSHLQLRRHNKIILLYIIILIRRYCKFPSSDSNIHSFYSLLLLCLVEVSYCQLYTWLRLLH